MILSTQTSILGPEFGDAAAIEMIASYGFDAYDFSFHVHETDGVIQNMEYMHHLRKVADDAGIICNQAHAPFPSERLGEDAHNEWMFNLIVKSMEAASILGAKHIVVHPICYVPEGQDLVQYNVDFYNRLKPYCQQFNIQVALENMFFGSPEGYHPAICSPAENFVDLLDRLDARWFVGCLDVGHCGVIGEDPVHAIMTLGAQRLKALHIHDNDLVRDNHTIPYQGKLNWKEITAALAQVGYEGDFTYEADNFLRGMPGELLPHGLKLLYETGRYLVSLIEKNK